jgi:hypothetical protein
MKETLRNALRLLVNTGQQHQQIYYFTNELNIGFQADDVSIDATMF